MTDTGHRPTGTLGAALGYAQRGWRVVPIIPGQKSPSLNRWTEVATTDPELIDQWWTTNSGHGVGIVTGARSGLFVLDVDAGPNKVGDETLADLEATYGPLPDTVECLTGSGGRHLYFRWPEGQEIRNDQAGRLGRDLDIRGEGGQCVAPPTIHPNGTAYHWESHGDPTDGVEVADAPRWLLELLQPPQGRPERLERKQRTARPGGQMLPGDRYEAATDWHDLLTEAGGTLMDTRIEHTTGERHQLWSRPPMPGEDGFSPHTSASLNYRGGDVLKVFTPNWRGVDPATGEIWVLDQEATYTRFGLYATMHHGGDLSAAAGALAADQADADWQDDRTPPAGEDWPDPEPLPVAETSHDPFPVDVFPAWMAAQIHQVAALHQVPVDLPATVALGALATLATGKAKIALGGGAQWSEHLNLYLVVAMPPGAGKSPVYRAMIRPVGDLETRLADAAASDIREAETAAGLIAKRIRQAEDKAAKDDEADVFDAAKRVNALKDQLADLEVPATPRLFADDATPEALVQMLGAHGGRMAILSTEGDVFDLIAGQYTEGRVANLGVYLKGHSGDTIKRDRTSRGQDKGDAIHIPEALLTICVTTQPAVIENLGTRADLARRGLPARFMFSVPSSLVGYRDRTKVYDTPDTKTTTAYTDALTALGERTQSWQNPLTLTIDEEASELFGRWDQDLEARQRPDGALAELAEWAQKLRASTLRVAGLIHLAHTGGDPQQTTVERQTMERAIEVADYWTAHATAVHNAWGADGAVSKARRILEWLASDEAPGELTARVVQKRFYSLMPTAADVVEPLEVLIAAGWLSTDGHPIAPGRGRLAAKIAVHPALRDHLRMNEEHRSAASSPRESRESRRGDVVFPPPPYIGIRGPGVDVRGDPATPATPRTTDGTSVSPSADDACSTPLSHPRTLADLIGPTDGPNRGPNPDHPNGGP